MNPDINFVNIDSAKNIAKKLFPECKEFTLIQHSSDNIVILVDKKFAMRFPRDKNSYTRSLHERYILSQLEVYKNIEIPRLIDIHSNQPYVITTFVSGTHFSAADIRPLPKVTQFTIAKDVAKFAYDIHSMLDLEKEQEYRTKHGLDYLSDFEPWKIYFKKVIGAVQILSTAQKVIVKKKYQEWVEICDVVPTVVVHDDLHTENMMFDKDHILSGVIDFADTNVGTPEQELRQLYRISEVVLLAGAEEYQRLSGKNIDVDAIKLWSIMKEIADYIMCLKNNNTRHHSFARSIENLNRWLPDGHWGSGYDLSGIVSAQ